MPRRPDSQDRTAREIRDKDKSDRLKAALKANMAKRKAQARARDRARRADEDDQAG